MNGMPAFDGTRNPGPFLGTAAITTDGTGTATITHTLGFIPSAVFLQPELASTGVLVAPTNHGGWTTTTFDVRAWQLSTGAVYVGPITVVNYLAWR